MRKYIPIIFICSAIMFNAYSQDYNPQPVSAIISYKVNIKENGNDNRKAAKVSQTINYPDSNFNYKILDVFKSHILKNKNVTSYMKFSPFNSNEISFDLIDKTSADLNSYKLGDDFVMHVSDGQVQIKKNKVYKGKTVVMDLGNIDNIEKINAVSFFEKWDIDPVSGNFVKEVNNFGLDYIDKNKEYSLFNFPTGSYKKEFYANNNDGTYSYNEGDILWENVVYDMTLGYNSNIDSDENYTYQVMNADNNNYYHFMNNEKKEEFVIQLLNCAKSNKCSVYKISGNNIDFTKVLNDEEILGEFRISESLWYEDYETYEIIEKIMYKDITVSDIKGLRFYETWFFDKETFSMKKIVNAVCLLEYGGMSKYEDWDENLAIPHLYIKLNNDIKTASGKILKNKLSQFDNYFKVADNLNKVCKDGKYYFINNKGERLNNNSYYWTEETFTDGLMKVEKFINDDDTQNIQIDEYGQIVQYDEYGELIIYDVSTICGYIDRSGKEIIECKYNNIEKLDNGMFLTTLDGKKGLLDKDGKTISETKYDQISFDNTPENMISVFIGDLDYWGAGVGKYGFIDYHGKEIVPLIYDAVDKTNYGLYKIIQNSMYGLMNSKGQVISECIYDDLQYFYNGLAIIRKDGLYGYIDSLGQEVIPAKYVVANEFYKDSAKVYEAGNYCYINKKSEKLSNCDYDKIKKQSDNVSIAHVGSYNGHVGLIDSKGKEIAPCTYYSIDDFVNGVAIFQKSNKYGLIDMQGKEILSKHYQDIRCHSDEIKLIYEDKSSYDETDTGKVYFYKVSTGEMIESDYIHVFSLSNTQMVFYRDNKIGFLDNDLKEYNYGKYSWMPDSYRSSIGFGYRLVYKGEIDSIYSKGKFGAIDSTGKEVIPCKYNWIYDFEGDSVTRVFIGEVSAEGVPKKGKFSLIDYKGRELAPFVYDDIYYFNNQTAIVFKGTLDEWGSPDQGKFGLINKKGKLVVPVIYDSISHSYYDQNYQANIGEEYFIFDEDGNPIKE